MAHIPVLLEETITGLNLKPGAVYVDGTLGSGGHAAAAFQSQKNVTIIGFDREGDAIKRAGKLLASLGAKPVLINDSFRNFMEKGNRLPWNAVCYSRGRHDLGFRAFSCFCYL